MIVVTALLPTLLCGRKGFTGLNTPTFVYYQVTPCTEERDILWALLTCSVGKRVLMYSTALKSALSRGSWLGNTWGEGGKNTTNNTSTLISVTLHSICYFLITSALTSGCVQRQRSNKPAQSPQEWDLQPTKIPGAISLDKHRYHTCVLPHTARAQPALCKGFPRHTSH